MAFPAMPFGSLLAETTVQTQPYRITSMLTTVPLLAVCIVLIVVVFLAVLFVNELLAHLVRYRVEDSTSRTCPFPFKPHHTQKSLQFADLQTMSVALACRHTCFRDRVFGPRLRAAHLHGTRLRAGKANPLPASDRCMAGTEHANDGVTHAHNIHMPST
eukprot:6184534-Pleurochrysis_carterae.AAC.2